MYAYVGKFHDSGSKNSFYKLKGKKYGFKSFPNKSLASFSHSVQNDLSSKNFAPKVLSPVCKIRVPNYFMGPNHKPIKQMVLSGWGYLTEIARPFICNNDECDGDCYYGYNDCVNNEIIDDLLNAIEFYFNFEYTDAHSGNLGYVTRKGKRTLVIIDVGRESLGDISDTDYGEPCWDGDDENDCYCTNCRKKYRYE